MFSLVMQGYALVDEPTGKLGTKAATSCRDAIYVTILRKNENCVKISTLHLTVLILRAIL